MILGSLRFGLRHFSVRHKFKFPNRILVCFYWVDVSTLTNKCCLNARLELFLRHNSDIFGFLRPADRMLICSMNAFAPFGSPVWAPWIFHIRHVWNVLNHCDPPPSKGRASSFSKPIVSTGLNSRGNFLVDWHLWIHHGVPLCAEQTDWGVLSQNFLVWDILSVCYWETLRYRRLKYDKRARSRLIRPPALIEINSFLPMSGLSGLTIELRNPIWEDARSFSVLYVKVGSMGKLPVVHHSM